MTKNKNSAIATSAILIAAMAIALLPLNAVLGQETRTTHAYMGATPNPVGVG